MDKVSEVKSRLPRPNTLGLRLVLSNALAFLLVLGFAFLALFLAIETVVDARMDEDLIEDIEEFSLWWADGGDEAMAREFKRETAAGEDQTVFLKLFDTGGEELLSSDMTRWQALELDFQQLQQVTRDPDQIVFATIDEMDGQDSATRVVFGSIAAERLLVIGESLEERDDLVELLSPILLLVFLLAVPLAAALVWWLTRRTLRGISMVAAAARDVRAGDLGRRVRARREAEEVQHLADTFDAMAERIERLVDGMRDMTDNMAHDLRSPLARIRVLAESAPPAWPFRESTEQTNEHIVDECDRLMHTINVSLDVAEAEAGVSRAPRRRVNLSERLSLGCELFADSAEARDITLTCEIESDCQVCGISESLERLFANLLDNAIKFTPDGGCINLQLQKSGSDIVVDIRDSGPGVPEALHERVFERFFRADASRNVKGCGLGLSYARAIVRLHGGIIEVARAAEGGARFTVKLPVAQSCSDA